MTQIPLFVAVAFIACSDASLAGQITGVVTADGQPVAGARITVFDPAVSVFGETRTDAGGSYFFSEAPGPATRLGVAARGYEYQEVPISTRGGAQILNFTLDAETHAGSWDVIGNTLPELFDATDIGILLRDGTVFFCHDTVDPIRFDPKTGVKTFPAGSGFEQGCMNGTLMKSGSIIMMGGQTPSDPGSFTNAIRFVKEYNQIADQWSILPQLAHVPGRWYPGMARLADGSLLVMGGGQAPNAARTSTAELLNLDTMTWSYTGSMLNPTEFPPCALLYTGEVLATWWPPQLYNVSTGNWRATGNFNQPSRFWPGHSDHSLIVLSDGRALAIGVVGGPNGNTVMAESYDPAAEQWSLRSNPALVRYQCEVVQLPDGRVLVAGGETEAANPPVDDVLGIVRWCDIYDPAIDQWRRVDDMIWHREYHAVTLLVPDGRVLTTGGTRIKFQVGPTSADIEAFSPPYLFRGVRPVIDALSTEQPRRAETVSIEISPATQITSVVLMGTQTTTHWVDGGIPRRLVLDVQQIGTTVECTIPCDPNVAMLGHYMLFAMVDDIPSVASIVRIRPRVGDLDGDGVVNVFDLFDLLAQWGSCSGSCEADVNDSGAVDVVDLFLLLSEWGGC